MDFDARSSLLITCAPKIAPWLETELREQQFDIEHIHDGGIGTTGSMRDTMRLNLTLRTAFNVLYLIRELQCRDGEDLYEQARQIEWEQIIPNDQYFCVVSRVDNPTINNSMYPTLKLKDAIVDRIAAQTGRRPDSGSDRHRVVVHLYWKQDQAWIYLNSSGQKLSDRSYRKIPHRAPLRESLAAAIIMAGEYDGGCPLVNPMCGSGTLAIEAALIAQNRHPGLLRPNFGFMHVLGFDSQAFRTLRNELRKEARPLDQRIIASDIDPQAVEAARKNATTAGVDHLIDFEVCDFAETTIPDQPGMIMLNPEYGQRLGEVAELKKTYRRIGDFFKQSCPGYQGYIFTGNMDLAKCVGLRTSRRVPFQNGDIECRLLRYELYQGTRKNYDRDPAPSQNTEEK